MKKNEVFIGPGELYYAKNGETIRTILGSCIGVFIFNKENKHSAACHYVLSTQASSPNHLNDKDSFRYGDKAIRHIFSEMKRHNAKVEDLEVYVLGGCEISNYKQFEVGKDNSVYAMNLLKNMNFSKYKKDIGGNYGREVSLEGNTGILKFRYLTNTYREKFNTFLSSQLISIGSSTGGTRAIEEVLSMLPEDIPPICIVQHMIPTQVKEFAQRLNLIFPYTIKIPDNGENLKPGCIYIAPGTKHLTVKWVNNIPKAVFSDEPPRNSFKPSVSVLFESLSRAPKKENITTLLLTGMGKDGAFEQRSLKELGCFNIVQDKDSSIVYGMPKAAIELGAADIILPLNQIGNFISKKIIKDWERYQYSSNLMQGEAV